MPEPGRAAPVIVLTYAHSGAGQLGYLLAGQPELACTSGTGILALCEQAAVIWASADGRAAGRRMSALAVAATQALISPIIASLLAREGKRRWCEFASASPGAARTFLQLYPETRIVCLYRACPDFIRAALRASPWGMASPAIAPFISTYPASTVTALTAYWAAYTSAMLALEQIQPAACRRLRHDDLTRSYPPGIHDFLGLDSPGPGAALWTEPARAEDPGAVPVLAVDPEPPMPVSQIPPPLLAQASDLMQQLGYPPLGQQDSRP